MKRRTLTLEEGEKRALENVRDHDTRAYLRERAAALLKINAGQIAYAVACRGLLKARDPDTIYAWIDQYQRYGLPGLIQKPRRKRRIPP